MSYGHPISLRRRQSENGSALTQVALCLCVLAAALPGITHFGSSASRALAWQTQSQSPVELTSRNVSGLSWARPLRAGRRAQHAIAIGEDLVTPLVSTADSQRAILRVIKEANERLYLSSHAIEDEYIPAILDAARRNVQVEILWSDPRRAGYSRAKSRAVRARFESLAQEPNINLREYSHKRLLMSSSAYLPELHAKLYGSDGQRLYIGDANLYVRGENLGAGVYIEGPSAARGEAEFMQLFSSEGTDYARVKVPAQAELLELLTSRAPDRNIKARLIEDINRAEESIFIMQYYFSDPDIVSALRVRKMQVPDLQVEVLLGRTHAEVSLFGRKLRYPFNIAVEQELRELGARVRFVSPDYFVHGKLVVVDKEVVHLGSADLTYRALEGNWELNARATSRELATWFLKQIGGYFEAGSEARASRFDRALSLAQRSAENALYRLGRLRHLERQASRATQLARLLGRGESATVLRKSVFAKSERIIGQRIGRKLHPELYGKADIVAAARATPNPWSAQAMDTLVRAELNVVESRKLAEGGDGIYLVAGHSEKRASVAESLGAQMSISGDIGPGIYLATDPRVAFEYSAIHDPNGIRDLLVYEANIERPFYLSRNRAEYETWLEAHPSPIKRARWQLLPEFARANGYDSVVMEDFEGLGSHYVMVLDREIVRPVHRYRVVDSQKSGWTRTLKSRLNRARWRWNPELSVSGETRTSKLQPIQYSFSNAARTEYERLALSLMRREGLTTPQKLNQELSQVRTHAAAHVKMGNQEGLLRLVGNYDLTRYRDLRPAMHERARARPVVQMSLYNGAPDTAISPELLEAGVLAARRYIEEVARVPTLLYIETRPNNVRRLESLGFQIAGRPFTSSAWDGKWVPLALEL